MMRTADPTVDTTINIRCGCSRFITPNVHVFRNLTLGRLNSPRIRLLVYLGPIGQNDSFTIQVSYSVSEVGFLHIISTRHLEVLGDLTEYHTDTSRLTYS